MAVLSDAERAATTAELEAKWSGDRDLISISSQSIRAAVNAYDSWWDENSVAANTALPQPAKAGLTLSQKADLMVVVARRRYLDG